MRTTLLRIGILAGLLGPGLRADVPQPPRAAPTAETARTTGLTELIQVLRTNLGLGPDEFEARASRALIDHFGARRLEAIPPNEADPIARRERLDGGVLYLRIGRVEEGLPEALRGALTDAAWITNAAGLVLDLRFAPGQSLTAATRSAALFSDRTEAVLRWDGASASDTAARRIWSLPVAVLVNGRTDGAAEALAAALRLETGAALVGQATAGTHGVYREAALADGSRLRIPSGRLRLGDGSPLEAGPVAPDIRIPVPEAAEREHLGNPTASLRPAGTNATSAGTGTLRRRVSEADLVRAQRNEPAGPPGRPEGQASGNSKDGAATPPTGVRLADPVLARAADLVRGLAAFRGATP